MTRKSVKKNYIYMVGFQILSLVTPLFTTPYVSRVLEPDGIGYYSFYNSICSYFVLFATLGTTSFGQREISFVQDRQEERSKIFWENVILRCITVLIALISWWIYIEQAQDQNKLFFIILGGNILGISIDISWFFQGMEEFGKTVGRSVFFKILNVILIFAFIREKDDLVIYVLLTVGLNLLSNLSLWTYLSKYIRIVRINELHPFRNIKAILSLFVPSIAIQIYTVLDKTMIGYFTELSYENGYYEQAVSLSKMVLSLVNAMVTVLTPRTGYYHETGDKERLEFYLYQSYRFVWFLALPLCLGLFGIAANFIPWFYGEKYDDMIPILRVASMLILVIGLNYVTGMQYLISTKRQKDYTYTIVLGAISNFMINLILIPRYFALGAIFASVAAETIIMLVQFLMIRKNLDVRKIFSFSKKYLVAGISMLMVVLFEDNYLEPSYINTILLISSGGVIYIGILILLKDEFLGEIKCILDQIRKRGG